MKNFYFDKDIVILPYELYNYSTKNLKTIPIKELFDVTNFLPILLIKNSNALKIGKFTAEDLNNENVFFLNSENLIIVHNENNFVNIMTGFCLFIAFVKFTTDFCKKPDSYTHCFVTECEITKIVSVDEYFNNISQDMLFKHFSKNNSIICKYIPKQKHNFDLYKYSVSKNTHVVIRFIFDIWNNFTELEKKELCEIIIQKSWSYDKVPPNKDTINRVRDYVDYVWLNANYLFDDIMCEYAKKYAYILKFVNGYKFSKKIWIVAATQNGNIIQLLHRQLDEFNEEERNMLFENAIKSKPSSIHHIKKKWKSDNINKFICDITE